ncbi:MAG: GNAT family N-acetyltransferase [Planctomycetes bacterium]|nr:GNAT family N-acetyltransferase [Planctomycetota bacterium]
MIAAWVGTAPELRWLAPSSALPLTAEKVVAWRKPGGHAMVWTRDTAEVPAAYAELNPMRDAPDHWWMGHVIVSPQLRGRGMGTAFVRALLNEAFTELLASRVSLVVFPENRIAIACYRRAGFTAIGEEYHRFSEESPYLRLLRLEARRDGAPGTAR